MHFVWATQLCKEKSEVKFQMQYYILVLYLLVGLFDQTCVDAVVSITYQDCLLGNIICTAQES